MSVLGDTGISEKEINFTRDYSSSGEFHAISFNRKTIFKIIVLALVFILFASFQTTFFTRFRPFGATPDLIMPLVISVALSEKEKFGAVFGLITGIIMVALFYPLHPLPILYAMIGYICGILVLNYFRASFIVRAIMTAAAVVIHGIVSLVVILASVRDVSFSEVMVHSVLPEMLSTMILSPIPHFIAYIVLKPFSSSKFS